MVAVCLPLKFLRYVSRDASTVLLQVGWLPNSRSVQLRSLPCAFVLRSLVLVLVWQNGIGYNTVLGTWCAVPGTRDVVILIFFGALVTTKQFVGQPITCWCPAQFTESHREYADSICWVSNTYYLPMETTIPGKRARAACTTSTVSFTKTRTTLIISGSQRLD